MPEVLEQFVTLFQPADGWVDGCPLANQPGYADELAYWRRLEREGRAVRFEPVRGSKRGGVLVEWRCPDLAEARRLAAASPMTTAGIVRPSTSSGTLGG